MDILILSRNPAIYSTQSLTQAARKGHHFVRIVDYANCDIIIENGKASIHYYGHELPKVQAIIPRIGAGYTNLGMRLIEQFESNGVYSSLSSKGLFQARDKILSMQLLARHGIPVPKTIIVTNDMYYDHMLSHFKSQRVVIKLVTGTHGNGVILAESHKQAANIIQAFGSKSKILVQEFIEEAKGSDVRTIVIEDKVVATMMRTSGEGDFRSNLHAGGFATKVKITAEEEEIAIKSAKVLGVKVAGVDIIRSAKGPKVLEVNASPGLEGIETTTGLDIAGKIIDFVEKEMEKQIKNVSK